MSGNIALRVCSLLLVAGWVGWAHAEGRGTPVLEDLSWMAGHWTATVDDVHMEEVWIEPAGGVMLGVHRDVRAGGGAFFEYLRIEARDNGVVYVASPMGSEVTEFDPGGKR